MNFADLTSDLKKLQKKQRKEEEFRWIWEESQDEKIVAEDFN